MNEKKGWMYIRKTHQPVISLDEQKVQLRKWSEYQGYKIVGETAILGGNEKSKNTIVKILHQEPPANGATYLITPSFSHLSRSFFQTVEILKELNEYGIGIITANNPVAPNLK